jgi:6-phosphogluconolactonase
MAAPEIVVAGAGAAWREAAARRIAGILSQALAARGAASLVLSGGSTPAPVYTRLAEPPFAASIDWRGVTVYWSDERCVPPGDPRSNFRLAESALLSRLEAAPRLCRIRGELAPAAAAERYEGKVRALAGSEPRFDLVLLGLGADGHTASLFPGSPALRERLRLAVPARAPVEPHARVTLTFPPLEGARHVLFLVAGAAKAAPLAEIFAAQAGSRSDDLPPAAQLRPRQGRLLWVVDEPAASRLPQSAAIAAAEQG